MPELGISLGLSPREDVTRFVSLIRTAEDLGVDAAWVIDSQMAMKDAYLAFAVAAWETRTIRVGPGVTNLVTRHETVVANAMSTAASMAPGRVLVGVGAGDSSVFPLGRKPLSIEACRAGIQRLRALLRGEDVQGLRLSFHAEPPPPIYLSASQPRMLRLAGAVADGVIIMGPADPQTIRLQLDHVDSGAAEAGRSPSEVVRDLWVTMAVGEPDQALADVKSWASAQARWLTTWRDVPASLERFRDEMVAAAERYDFGVHLSRRADHAGGVSDEFARVLAIAGTPDECGRRLTELLALGPGRVTVTLLSGGREQRLADIVDVWQQARAG